MNMRKALPAALIAVFCVISMVSVYVNGEIVE